MSLFFDTPATKDLESGLDLRIEMKMGWCSWRCVRIALEIVGGERRCMHAHHVCLSVRDGFVFCRERVAPDRVLVQPSYMYAGTLTIVSPIDGQNQWLYSLRKVEESISLHVT